MKYFILYFKYFLMHKIGIFALTDPFHLQALLPIRKAEGHEQKAHSSPPTLFIKFPAKHNLSLGRIKYQQRLYLYRMNNNNSNNRKKDNKKKKKKKKKEENENEKWKMYFQQITQKFYSCRFHAASTSASASAPQKICFIIWKSNGENGPNNKAKGGRKSRTSCQTNKEQQQQPKREKKGQAAITADVMGRGRAGLIKKPTHDRLWVGSAELLGAVTGVVPNSSWNKKSVRDREIGAGWTIPFNDGLVARLLLLPLQFATFLNS